MARFVDNLRGRISSPTACWWILLIGIGVRVAWILVFDVSQVYDARIYYAGAEIIHAGDSLPLTGSPSGHWPVGYQGFLAGLFTVFGISTLVAQTANIVLSGFVLIATRGIARSLSGSTLVANLAMLLLAAYPRLIVICSLAMPEMLYLSLMLGGLWAWVGLRGWLPAAVVTGVTYGVATLVRPQLFVIPLGYALIRRPREVGSVTLKTRVLRTTLVACVMAVVLTPWLIRNARQYEQFVFVSTNSGYMLLIGNNPHATGGVMSPARAAPAYKQEFDGGVDGDRLARRLAVEYASQHPVATVALWPMKLWLTFRSGLGTTNWVRAGLADSGYEVDAWFWIIQYTSQAWYMLILLAALSWLGIQAARGLPSGGKPKLLATYLVPVIVLLILPSVITVGSARYNLALIPWLAMLAGAALNYSRSRPPGSDLRPGAR